MEHLVQDSNNSSMLAMELLHKKNGLLKNL